MDIQKGAVTLRILNLLPEPVHLYKGTLAALAVPVRLYSHHQSNCQHVSQICQHEGNGSPSRLPEQLEVLLEKCAENLSAN